MVWYTLSVPKISVITPTWRRNSLLLNRCVPSVQAQQEKCYEHIIVSDGPDEFLREYSWEAPVRYFELETHEEGVHWGHLARSYGLRMARGEYIAYLDDDDCWEAEHLRLLTEALDIDLEAGFAFSRALVHTASGIVRIGDGRPSHGRVQSSMLMHRRSVLKIATWAQAHPAEDWLLVQAWLQAGVPYASVGTVTVHHYPSVAVDLSQCALAAGPPPEVKLPSC